MMVSMALTATQTFCCSVCRREEKTIQHGDSLAGPGTEPFGFAVKLPPGWHTFDGRLLCSLNCALHALDKAWPEWRPSRKAADTGQPEEPLCTCPTVGFVLDVNPPRHGGVGGCGRRLPLEKP